MIRQLLDRRVPQFLGLYLGATWGFLEFFDWAVDRYLLSPRLVDFVLALLLLFLPTVLVVAWRHGAPGPDEWKRKDAAAIGLNTLVAVVVLFVAFRGEHLGATATVQLIEDAEGNQVERVVPRADARRNVLLFDLENETGMAAHDWLEAGVTFALGIDLAQDVFVTAIEPVDQSVREFLAERGLELDDDIPLPLKRDAARLRGIDYFLAGSIHEGADSLRIRTRLYETGTGRVVESHDYGMVDAREVVDRISLDLRRDLGIPDGQLQQSVDLPAQELLADTPEAYRLAAESWETLLRDNDPVRANELAQRALTLDSTAAISHLAVVNAALFLGDQAAASAAVRNVLKYDYRLPERWRLAVQVQNEFLFEQDYEAAVQAGRYWTEIYPQDVEARRLLAAILGVTGDSEEQIRQLRALLSVDSTDVAAMRQIAAAFAAERRYDSAVAYGRRLIERQPGDLGVRLELASILEGAGRYDDARETLEEAAVVAPQDPDVPRQLATLDIRRGDFGHAERRLDEVKQLERTPAERERRIGLEETLHYQRGQFGALEDAYHRRLAALTESHPLVNAVGQINSSEFLQFAHEAGRAAAALAQIDSLQRLVQPPWSTMLEISAVRNHLGTGDVEAARASLATIEESGAPFGTAASRLAFLAWVQGEIARLEDGNCRRALPLYDEALDLNPLSQSIHVTRLECLTELERWQAAREEADWLLEHYPGRPTHRLAVARYFAARRQTAEAIPHLEYALGVWSNADPGYLPAQEARALLARLRA